MKGYAGTPADHARRKALCLKAKQRRFLWNWCKARGIRININMYQQMGCYYTMRRSKRKAHIAWLEHYLIPKIEERMELEGSRPDRYWLAGHHGLRHIARVGGA